MFNNGDLTRCSQILSPRTSDSALWSFPDLQQSEKNKDILLYIFTI